MVDWRPIVAAASLVLVALVLLAVDPNPPPSPGTTPPREAVQGPFHYLEDEAALRAYWTAATQWMAQAPCHAGVAEPEPSLHQIRVVLDACQENWSSASDEVARAAHSSGTVEQEYEAARRLAERSVAREAESLDGRRTVATIPEAELVAALAGTYSFHVAIIHTSELLMDEYRDTLAAGDPYQNAHFAARDAFSNLAWAREGAQEVMKFIEAYPWTPGECTLDEDAFLARLHGKADEALSLANEHGNPRDAEFITQRYGALVKSTLPAMERYEARGWVLPLLRVESYLDWTIGYFDAVRDGRSLTYEEGWQRWLEWNAGDHTLSLDHLVSGVEDRFDVPELWDYSGTESPHILGLANIEWHFADLACPDGP